MALLPFFLSENERCEKKEIREDARGKGKLA
jgi:hypothetical protein